MNILHFADTHLGYSAYRKATKEGINQREIDVYDSFKQIIDYAVENKPDIILHSGDLFDSVRPNNRAINVALEQILRLSKADIPFVVISGNHETPRLKETGHIFTIFDHLKQVYPVYKNVYENISFTIKNQIITIHAVPQCFTKEEFKNNLKKIKLNKKSNYNILMAHGSVKGIKELSMNEFNEQIIPSEILKKNFDYIALGHYHKYTKIKEKTYYSGSPESLTFADANEQKGFLKIDLTKQKTKFIPLNTRPMIDLPKINCTNQTITTITNNIQKQLKQIKPDNKIIRINLQNIPVHTYRGIDFNQIRKQNNTATHFEIKTEITREGETIQPETTNINSLTEEYQNYLKKQDIKEKKQILKLGLDYITKYTTRDEK